MQKMVTVALLLVLLTIGGVLYNIRLEQKKEAPQKAVLILNGSAQDHSWNEAHVRGMTLAAGKQGVELLVRENVPEDEQCLPVIEAVIADGARYVFCTSFGFGEWTKKLADKYPELYFFQCTGLQKSRNILTYFNRLYQMRYLAGIVAGMETQSGRIGYVGAMRLPEAIRGIDAFTLGVRHANPRAQVFVTWSNSWNDDEKNGAAALRLLDGQQVDVLTLHTNSLRPLLLAEERGVRTIGCNLENPALLPRTYLTAAVFRWENNYEKFLRSAMQGNFRHGLFWEGMEAGVVGLGEFSRLVSKAAIQAVDEERFRLQRSGQDVFNGPIYDNQGVLRVPAEETVGDRYLLEKLDWFVEGVVLCE